MKSNASTSLPSNKIHAPTWSMVALELIGRLLLSSLLRGIVWENQAVICLSLGIPHSPNS